MSSDGPAAGPAQTIAECKEDDNDIEATVPGQTLPVAGSTAPVTQRYHTVLPATISFLKPDRAPFYMACPEQLPDDRAGPGKFRPCNRKVEHMGSEWCCTADHRCQEPIARWVLNFAIADHTGTMWVSAFDEAGQQVIGCSATEVARLWQDRDSDTEAAARIEEIFKAAHFRRMRMRLRSKKEVWNDEERTKVNLVECGSVKLETDARLKLASIMSALEVKGVSGMPVAPLGG